MLYIVKFVALGTLQIFFLRMKSDFIEYFKGVLTENRVEQYLHSLTTQAVESLFMNSMASLETIHARIMVMTINMAPRSDLEVEISLFMRSQIVKLEETETIFIRLHRDRLNELLQKLGDIREKFNEPVAEVRAGQGLIYVPNSDKVIYLNYEQPLRDVMDDLKRQIKSDCEHLTSFQIGRMVRIVIRDGQYDIQLEEAMVKLDIIEYEYKKDLMLKSKFPNFQCV